MSFFSSRSRKAPYLPVTDIWPDAPSVGEARRAAMAFALGELSQPPPRKTTRARLPDVDFSQAVPDPKRSLLERLFGFPRALRNHHKPTSRVV